MKNIIALVGGVIFAVGLVVSGMTDPKKVIGFLDIFGEWDYALAFVMGGAVLVNLILFTSILKRDPVYGDSHDLPKSDTNITSSLVVGSAMFV